MKKLLTIALVLCSIGVMGQNTITGQYELIRDTYTLVDRPVTVKTLPSEIGIRFMSGSPEYKPVAFVSQKDSILHVYDSGEAGKALMRQWEYNRKEREDMLKMLTEAIKQNQELKRDLAEIRILVRRIKP